MKPAYTVVWNGGPLTDPEGYQGGGSDRMRDQLPVPEPHGYSTARQRRTTSLRAKRARQGGLTQCGCGNWHVAGKPCMRCVSRRRQWE